MASEELPRPPHILLFEEVVPDARPLAILVDERGTVPLFDSAAKAAAFLASTNLGLDLEPVEVSRAGLIRALESVKDAVEYVALNPPPAREGGMRVQMGSLRELVDALEASRQGDDLFGLGSGG
jgi:16S rRNA G527 N7-methylase RsmG